MRGRGNEEEGGKKVEEGKRRKVEGRSVEGEEKGRMM